MEMLTIALPARRVRVALAHKYLLARRARRTAGSEAENGAMLGCAQASMRSAGGAVGMEMGRHTSSSSLQGRILQGLCK